MKHLIKLSLLLLAFLLPAIAIAHDFEVDGIYYNFLNDNEVEVTYQGNSTSQNYNRYSGDVSIPSTVTFNGVTYSVTAIGNSAFCDCTDLTGITIPNSVTSIGELAFNWCSSLIGIDIPSSVTSIGKRAFSNCAALTGMTVASNNQTYDSRDNCNAVIETATNTLVAGCNNTVISNSVTSIGDCAFFECRGLTSITIPNSVITIENNAFFFCNDLTNITIGDSVTSIGEFAFSGCASLRNVSMGNSVTTIGKYAFEICHYLMSITIPNSVTSIGEGAFYECEGLTDITIGNSVTSIGAHAFENCSGLTSITIPNSVTTIGDNSFSGCSGLTNVTLGNSLTTIGNYAFYACPSLSDITIPKSVTTIGDQAFSGNYDGRGLINVTIDNSVVAIGKGAFADCRELINIDFGDSVISIGDEAFSHCNALKSIAIPNSLVTIGHEAFIFCYGLKNITIPNSVTSIGDNAFNYCNGLTSVTLGGSVVSIGEFAFRNCSGLTSVSIPKSVTFIGDRAFSCCSGINEVYSYITDLSKVSIGLHVFEPMPKKTGERTLYVPYGTLADYQADWNWNHDFDTIVEMDPVPAASIELDKTSAVALIGETLQLTATVLPEDATDKSVSWASSNPGVATVDGNGFVTAVNVGTATITAVTTDGSNLSASCTVTVRNLSASECFSVNDLTAFHGDTIVIPVAMINEASIISFQTDIYLPEGLELLQEDGEYLIDPSPRMTTTHSIMSNAVSNGSIRVVCYSANYKPFKGESGDDLFYLTVKVADDAEGDYNVQLKNTLFTTSDFDEIAVPDAAANVNVKSYIAGDANNSGTVTVTDVVVASQYILELNPEPFNFTAADVNEDGSITVTDVSRIAWMVLNPASKAPLLRAPALWNNGDLMSGNDLTLAAGENRRVSITLDNALAYSAFQLDMHLPEGLTASNFALTDRAGSHAFDVNTLHSGAIRALCYSPALTAIRGHEGALLTFDVTSTGTVNGCIIVDGIELVTTDCQTVILDGFNIGVNTVTSVNELSDGKAVARIDYFNLAGQQIDRPDSGVTLVVTTYTDGTRTTTKLIR